MTRENSENILGILPSPREVFATFGASDVSHCPSMGPPSPLASPSSHSAVIVTYTHAYNNTSYDFASLVFSSSGYVCQYDPVMMSAGSPPPPFLSCSSCETSLVVLAPYLLGRGTSLLRSNVS